MILRYATMGVIGSFLCMSSVISCDLINKVEESLGKEWKSQVKVEFPGGDFRLYLRQDKNFETAEDAVAVLVTELAEGGVWKEVQETVNELLEAIKPELGLKINSVETTFNSSLTKWVAHDQDLEEGEVDEPTRGWTRYAKTQDEQVFISYLADDATVEADLPEFWNPPQGAVCVKPSEVKEEPAQEEVSIQPLKTEESVAQTLEIKEDELVAPAQDEISFQHVIIEKPVAQTHEIKEVELVAPEKEEVSIQTLEVKEKYLTQNLETAEEFAEKPQTETSQEDPA